MNQKRLAYTLLLILLLTLFAFPVQAQSTKPLPETYVSDDESLTLRYPHGWAIQTDIPGQLVIATDESLFDLGDEEIPSGEAALGILFLDSDSDLTEILELGDEPITILNSLTKLLFEQGENQVELGTPETLIFADHPAARVAGTFMDNAIFLIIIDQGEQNFLMFVGVTSADEMPKFEPKLLAIAESVHYLPPTE